MNEAGLLVNDARRSKPTSLPHNSGSMALRLIILSGDIAQNPGPKYRYPCGACSKPVKSNQKGIHCDSCDTWYHTKCCSISDESYDNLVNVSGSWICCKCDVPNFSRSLTSSAEIPEENFYQPLSSLVSSPSGYGSLHQHTNSSTKPSFPVPSRETSHKHMNRKLKKLRVMSINARSLKSQTKRLEFQNLVDLHKPAIVNVNETHISDSLHSSEILESGYTIFRKDRDTYGGGVLSAFSNDLIVSHENHLADDYEGVWSKVEIAGSKPLYVGSIYRPPNSDVEPLEALDQSLSQLSQKSPPNILLTGDFNLPSISWDDDNYSTQPNPAYGTEVNNKLLDIVNNHFLTQHVKQPTRGHNILDLVFTTNPNVVADLKIQSGMSDHDAVIFDINLKPSTNRKQPRKVFIFKKGNMEVVRNDLKQRFDKYIETEALSNSVDVNYYYFKSTINEVMKKNIPQKNINGRWNVPWLTNSIKRMTRKKQRLYNKARRTDNPSDWKKFKEMRKCIKKQLTIAHNEYVSDLLTAPEKSRSNKEVPSKRFWSYIKSKKTHDVGIPPLKDNGADVNDNYGKANLLSNQFKSVFTKENLDNIPSLGPSPYPDVPSTVFTIPGILKLLNNVNPKKANGPDLIPCRILKEAAMEIAPFLKLLFTQSMESGTVPKDWLKANITPVFKKGSKHLASNYRPISH